MNLAHK